MLRRVLGVGAVGFAGGVYVAFKNRPYPSTHEVFRQKDVVPEPQMNAVEKTLRDFAGTLTMGAVTAACRTVMGVGENLKILEPEKLTKYTASDRGGRPLVTVSNHHTVLDEPFLVAVFTPWRVLLSPKKMRMSVCSEELCFANGSLSTFFSLGNGLPIQRGGSLHQRAVALWQQRLNEGGWVHLYPEGRCWQENGLPQRDEAGRYCSPTGRCGKPYSKVGPLKWGIAKVVCNAEQTPIIVPMFHQGMEFMMPQDQDNQLVAMVPNFGKTITMGFGDPVEVQDLIDAYHVAAARRAEARKASKDGSSGATPPDFEVEMLSADDEVVPSRKNKFGVLIPAYRERALRIKPPDHGSLSPEEAIVEERFRLELYSHVATRLADGIRAAEVPVRKYRRDVLGLSETDDVYGPTWTRSMRTDVPAKVEDDWSTIPDSLYASPPLPRPPSSSPPPPK